MNVKSLSSSLKVQGLIGLVAIAIFTYQNSLNPALYGFFIGIMNVLALAITFKKANSTASEDPKMGVMILYMSAVIRFVLLAVLFVLGLSFLGLEPVPVVLTFIVMQIGQIFSLTGKRRLTD